MKTASAIIFLVLCCFTANAQKMPADYFDEAGKLCENREYEKALQAYKYIVDHYPKNELYPKSFYNMGYVYFNQGRFDKAMPVFNTILHSNFNEKEELGGNIMDDPYTNYKHRVCELLSEIYYRQKNYDSALYYFALSDTAHPYLHFCGNEHASNDVYTALRYANIYKKIKQPGKAIEKLLPAVFIILADNSKVITELQNLLKGKPNVKASLDESLENMYLKEVNTNGNEYRQYYFRFLNTEIAVPGGYEDTRREFDKQKAIKQIALTSFYKMIAKL
jgi:tetratricopeptide (TPR) repeat protein